MVHNLQNLNQFQKKICLLKST